MSANSFNILILEDELPAYKKLYQLVVKGFPEHHLIGWARTVHEAKELLSMSEPDLIFSDIELLDGTSFEVFQHHEVNCPIIFTTAYNQYLFDAFQTNGIAYLLKPFNEEEFDKAVTKYKSVFAGNTFYKINAQTFAYIEDELHSTKNNYKRRISVKKQNGFKILNVDAVVRIEAQGDFSLVYDLKDRYILNQSLGIIGEKLDPAKFYRINRSEILNIDYIEKLDPHSKNRLYVTLKDGYRCVTSEKKTPDFRRWLES